MDRKSGQTHPLHQCALFKLRSKRRLADTLQCSQETLRSLIRGGDRNYQVFSISRPGKKPRQVETPKNSLKAIHRRLFNLLAGITPPSYLHSGIKRRSYITNARQHLGTHQIAKLDIKSFFPSTTFGHVYGFFAHVLQCSPDVATMLTKLTTVDSHLPTGSCVSQMLAFYAHLRMFESIARLSEKTNIRMTCYVDDLTFSGEALSPLFIFQIKKLIHQRGLRYHKERFYAPTDAKVVTGTVLKDGKLLVPNRLQRDIHKGLVSSPLSMSDQDLSTLIGKCNAAAQIEDRFQSTAKNLRAIQRKR